MEEEMIEFFTEILRKFLKNNVIKASLQVWRVIGINFQATDVFFGIENDEFIE